MFVTVIFCPCCKSIMIQKRYCYLNEKKMKVTSIVIEKMKILVEPKG